MGTIKQATYGDEKTSTDVTDVLVNMYKKGNQSLNLVAGPTLLSQKEVGVKVELNGEEKETIRKQALESCGNALDEACMKTTQQSLTASKLEEKARKEAEKPIVGERLTVTVVDARGKEKKLVIPKDKEFRFGRQSDPQGARRRDLWNKFTDFFTIGWAGAFAGKLLLYFIWVFGTAFAWVSLNRQYVLPSGKIIDPSEYSWLKYVGAGAGVMTAGYGGFMTVLIAAIVLGAKHYIVERSLLFSKQ
jgi:hypothetical protein